MARIMVVEDDVYMREELTDLLRKSGYETASLFDFENAIPEITEYSPDLVLLDINLPFHSGFEICKELKAKQLGTVLVLTARDKLQDELHALGLGADDYLTKPCNIERLLARIKNLLRRKEEQIRQGLLDGNGFLLDPNTFTIYVGKSSLTMPTELLKAHKANNRAVMHAYGFSIKMSEADCVAELMRMYQKLTKEK